MRRDPPHITICVIRGSCIAAVFALAAAFAWGQAPASVVVIANDNDPASRSIAEYYSRHRAIPAGNVCRLQVTPEEEIDRAVYDRAIAAPVAAFLRRRGLVEQALYLATTTGVPLKIRGSAGRDATAASVDSELAVLYLTLHGQPAPLPGPLRNPFYRQQHAPFEHPRFPLYLVTRLTGYTFADVRGLIDRALAAQNRGRVVLDLKDDSVADGDYWLRRAAQELPPGRVVIDKSAAVLTGLSDVIGYAGWGSNDPHRKERLTGMRFLPGALATQFVSTDGRTFHEPPPAWRLGVWSTRDAYFAGSPQSLTADLIREGVTGASGHVYEPYLDACPRPDILFPAYLAGRNLAESYYLAIPGLSWQNIVVGDPLCRLAPPGR